jgi:hypothetical protein
MPQTPDTIEWRDNWKQAVSDASAARRPLYLFLYSPT